jgi:hypothetical protein
MESNAPASSQTPWHLWAIGIVAVMWNGFGAYDYLATVIPIESYMQRFTPEQRAYFESFPVWAVSAWAIAIWSSVLGSLALLIRKRWAVWLFGLALVAMVVSYVYTMGISDGMEMMGTAAFVMTLIIFVIAIGLFLYSRAMASRGVLS